MIWFAGFVLRTIAFLLCADMNGFDNSLAVATTSGFLNPLVLQHPRIRLRVLRIVRWIAPPQKRINFHRMSVRPRSYQVSLSFTSWEIKKAQVGIKKIKAKMIKQVTIVLT